MNQSEHLRREVETLERQLRDRDEEIVRLRGELSRAAVREGEATKALEEIAKGEGPYSRDQIEHAENTIKYMVRLAEETLAALLDGRTRKEG